MSNYRRLISYIYAYEGGVKGKNIGFAKIEVRNGQCRIQVSVKKIFLGSSDTEVYLLTAGEEIPLGRIFIRNGSGEFRISVSAADVEGSGYSMDQCYGLTLHETDNAWRCYTTIWEDAVAHAAELELAEVTAERAETPPAPVRLPISEEIERELEQEEREREDRTPWEEDAEVPGGADVPGEADVPGGADVLGRVDVPGGADVPGEAVVPGKMDVAGETAKPEDPEDEDSFVIEELTGEMMSVQDSGKENEPGVRQQRSAEGAAGEPAGRSQESAERIADQNWRQGETEGTAGEPANQEEQQGLSEEPADQTGYQEPDTAWIPEPGDPSRLQELDRQERESSLQNSLWNRLQRTYAKVLAFDCENGCEILSIKPQDIGILPRENWVYGNNSFLLHGYYNYRHLILARLENPQGAPRYLLGVPGHYFSNEKRMAAMFGFSHFVLAKKQPEEDGRFGYWYTDVRL